MILGFLPPNSKDNFLNIGAAFRAMASPVFVPPVNDIALIFGCSTIACPAEGPVPLTIFKTPFGNPAFEQISPNKNAVIGVTSLGFATTVLPAASAGAIFQVNKYSGKFQGEIHPTTPMGCRSVKFIVLSPILSCASLENCVMACAKNLKLLDALGISTDFAKLNGFPLSKDSASANFSKLSSIKSAIFERIALRSLMVVLDQDGKAFLAA